MHSATWATATTAWGTTAAPSTITSSTWPSPARSGTAQARALHSAAWAICYYSLGDYRRAIDHHEQSLAIAREIGDRQGEGNALCNLGHCYYSLGDYRRAIDHIEQSLAIAREIGDRYVESNGLVYLGVVYRDTGQLPLACKHFQDAIDIADATGDRQNQHEARFGLALARLYAGELAAARESIDGARRYDFPANTMAAWTATGIIRLRQGEPVAASEAFARGLAEADGLLALSGQNVSALDNKGLALCGLALCEDERHLPARRGGLCRRPQDHASQRRGGKRAEPVRCPGTRGQGRNPGPGSQSCRRRVSH